MEKIITTNGNHTHIEIKNLTPDEEKRFLDFMQKLKDIKDGMIKRFEHTNFAVKVKNKKD